MTDFVIRKLDPQGREVFRYPADRVLSRTATSVTIEATFARQERLELGYATFERGDRFVEHFYSDRWYNVFEIHATGTDALRGWYCNVARPALITETEVAQVDLALDVWVRPDGSTLVLDEDEFSALALPTEVVAEAREAVREVQRLALERSGPFRPDPPPGS